MPQPRQCKIKGFLDIDMASAPDKPPCGPPALDIRQQKNANTHLLR
jgi:hypothetical protein